MSVLVLCSFCIVSVLGASFSVVWFCVSVCRVSVLGRFSVFFVCRCLGGFFGSGCSLSVYGGCRFCGWCVCLLAFFVVGVCVLGVSLFRVCFSLVCVGAQVLCGSGFCVFGAVFGVLGCVGGRFFCFLAVVGGFVLWGWLFLGWIFLFG